MAIIQQDSGLLQEVNGLLDKDNIKDGGITTKELKGFSSPVTSLPASPQPGDICIYQNASMATNGIRWLLQYNAASGSTYKWEFIGGSSLYGEVAGQENMGNAGGTWWALATAGPSITLPLGGDYFISNGFSFAGQAIQVVAYMSYDIGATGAIMADAVGAAWPAITYPDLSSPMRKQRKNALPAVVLTSKYSNSGGNVGFAHRWIEATPIRVG
jgi:hypothetical protein